jgi:ATP-dependent DNA helicase RecG
MIADIVRDAPLLNEARRDAFSVVDNDPELSGNHLLRESLKTFWQGKAELYKIG